MLEAKKVLDCKWFETYKKEVNALFLEIAELNTRLFILEKISNFNFNLFSSGNNTFWFFTASSLFESCVMCAWRIAIDTDGNSLTAKQLKNAIRKHVVDITAKKQLQQELKKVDFDNKIKKVSAQIQKLRHKRYGHFNRQVVTQAKFPKVYLHDLEIVKDALNNLAQVLGLENKFMFLPIDYDPHVKHPLNTDPRPDIVRILDDVALNSEIVRLPEKLPEVWQERKKPLSEKAITEINRYRQMLGLPKA